MTRCCTDEWVPDFVIVSPIAFIGAMGTELRWLLYEFAQETC
jgi:hypothetical protein